VRHPIRQKNKCEQENAPELPIGRFLKSKFLGGNRVILVVIGQKGTLAVAPMKLRSKLLVATILLAATAPVVYIAITPTTGTGFERSKAPILGLPTNAADIDFMLRPTAPVSAYSFNTDETSFVDWSERYLGLEDSREGHVSIQGIDVLSGTTTMIESPDGIAYSWSEEDRGQYTLFDRKQGRAYYFAHTR
jgi:hypothetical protein